MEENSSVENWKHLNMMDIYVKIEMIANGFLHFDYRKVGS